MFLYIVFKLQYDDKKKFYAKPLVYEVNLHLE